MSSRYGLHKRISFIFDGEPGGSPETAADSALKSAKVSDAAFSADAGTSAPPSAFVPGPAPAKTAPPRPRRTGDPRQRRMLILAALLLPVFGGALGLMLFSPEAARGKSTAASDPSSAAVKTPSVVVKWNKPAPWPPSMRDPMQIARVSATAGTEKSDLTVRGIVVSRGRSSAIVGERIVFEGETVRGATIRKIGKDSVEFERDGKIWTQQVQP